MFESSRARVHRVRRGALAGLAVGVAVVIGTAAAAGAAPPEIRAGAKHGIVMARGYAGHGHGHGKSSLLTWHGGPVMTSGANVTAIYWGPSWDSSTFVGDKQTGLASFYKAVGGSDYIGTNAEYTNDGTTTGTPVGLGVSYAGSVVDDSPTPTKLSPHAAPTTSDVLAVVRDSITSPVADGYYPVYSDIPRGHRSYCAWHSDGTIGTTHVQFAFFFDLANDPGCDPGAPASLGQSEGLSALANVSGHELSEALTDPWGTAWYDRQGLENADKCAWTFNGIETLQGNSRWYIQGNFSNDAYAAGSGYDGGGCINGN